MRPFKKNNSGIVAILITVLSFVVVGTLVSLFQMRLTWRSSFQAKIKRAFESQIALEELAKYIRQARDLANQGTCPPGTNDSDTYAAGTAGYLPGTNPDPLRICWTTPPGTPPPGCVGVLYNGNYYCLTDQFLVTENSRPDGISEENELVRLSTELNSQKTYSGFSAINAAYADYEPQWPVNNGETLLSAGLDPALLTTPGSSQGYGDNACRVKPGDPYRCVSLKICPSNTAGPACLPVGAVARQIMIRITDATP